jgi:hypothetical protein
MYHEIVMYHEIAMCCEIAVYHEIAMQSMWGHNVLLRNDKPTNKAWSWLSE